MVDAQAAGAALVGPPEFDALAVLTGPAGVAPTPRRDAAPGAVAVGQRLAAGQQGRRWRRVWGRRGRGRDRRGPRDAVCAVDRVGGARLEPADVGLHPQEGLARRDAAAERAARVGAGGFPA